MSKRALAEQCIEELGPECNVQDFFKWFKAKKKTAPHTTEFYKARAAARRDLEKEFAKAAEKPENGVDALLDAVRKFKKAQDFVKEVGGKDFAQKLIECV